MFGLHDRPRFLPIGLEIPIGRGDGCAFGDMARVLPVFHGGCDDDPNRPHPSFSPDWTD